VQAGSGTLQCIPNDRVDTELIATAVNAELQVGWQPILLDGVCNHRQIVVEFLLELDEIADVVDSFVKSTSELRRDCLQLHFLVGERGENDQQFRWSLRRIRLVHRDFRDDLRFTFCGRDIAINLSGILHRQQVLGSHSFDILPSDHEGSTNPRNTEVAHQFGMSRDKLLHVAR
jgi:hypothetical protein